MKHFIRVTRAYNHKQLEEVQHVEGGRIKRYLGYRFFIKRGQVFTSLYEASTGYPIMHEYSFGINIPMRYSSIKSILNRLIEKVGLEKFHHVIDRAIKVDDMTQEQIWRGQRGQLFDEMVALFPDGAIRLDHHSWMKFDNIKIDMQNLKANLPLAEGQAPADYIEQKYGLYVRNAIGELIKSNRGLSQPIGLMTH